MWDRATGSLRRAVDWQLSAVSLRSAGRGNWIQWKTAIKSIKNTCWLPNPDFHWWSNCFLGSDSMSGLGLGWRRGWAHSPGWDYEVHPPGHSDWFRGEHVTWAGTQKTFFENAAAQISSWAVSHAGGWDCWGKFGSHGGSQPSQGEGGLCVGKHKDRALMTEYPDQVLPVCAVFIY